MLAPVLGTKIALLAVWALFMSEALIHF